MTVLLSSERLAEIQRRAEHAEHWPDCTEFVVDVSHAFTDRAALLAERAKLLQLNDQLVSLLRRFGIYEEFDPFDAWTHCRVCGGIWPSHARESHAEQCPLAASARP